MKKKIALGLVALVAVAGGVAGMSAFEAHVINVTAKIENALNVPLNELKFGTVFPQEKFDKTFDVRLSDSFQEEDRVDDIEYVIRQKPKCADNADNPTEFSQVTEEGGVFKCKNPQHVILPLLCPYLSKSETTSDGTAQENDGKSIQAFHGLPGPWTLATTLAHQVKGKLIKSAQDFSDTWNIDLKVPCFGGHCAQDWEEFVAGINDEADPDDYVQPIANEHKIFGCDLWIEVLGVSLAVPCVPGDFTVVSDTTNTVGGNGNAVAVSSLHPEWTAVIPGATWIWSEDPISTQTDQTGTFVKQFNVSGTSVTTASLMIATDNTYSVKVNGSAVCSSVDEDNFHLATQDVCPVTNLVAGSNTLEITVNNIGVGSLSNPAGLLYKLSYTTVCETLGCSEKADVMLVLDRSGSINDAEEALMKTGAKAFVDALSPLSDTVGPIMGMSSFGTTGSLDQTLTSDSVSLKAKIEAITTPGGSLTNLFEGINLAKVELGGVNDRPDGTSPDFMVIITDGNPNQPPNEANARAVAKAEADAARAAGIEIFVVGIGSDVDAAYLKTIADNDAHYFSASDFAALEAILKNLATCPG